jgi:hypothetical protein
MYRKHFVSSLKLLCLHKFLIAQYEYYYCKWFPVREQTIDFMLQIIFFLSVSIYKYI